MPVALPKFGALPTSHKVADQLIPGLEVVFCGTALGRVSAQQKAYYANPTNLFWRTLHQVGLTPRLFKPQEYSLLLPLGIGLTDLCKTAFGNDAELPKDALDRDALEAKIMAFQPGILAFTSKKGAATFLSQKSTGKLAYGEHAFRVASTRLFILPSPSGQGRKYWDEAPWRALADAVRNSAAGKNQSPGRSGPAR